jgi:hypothetical protein
MMSFIYAILGLLLIAIAFALAFIAAFATFCTILTDGGFRAWISLFTAGLLFGLCIGCGNLADYVWSLILTIK